MEIVFSLIIGITVGSVAAWLIAKSKFSSTNEISPESFTQLDKQKSILEVQLKTLIDEKTQLNSELSFTKNKLEEANIRVGKAEEIFKMQKERIEQQAREQEELQKKLTSEFENIANKILDQKSQKFTEQNKNNLDIILNPLKEKIKEFEQKVDQTYKAESAERITLKAEIKSLVEMNKQISEEANNLARALKGDNKKQGNWGELILEKILERSGLIKDQEYKTQVSTQNEEGRRFQPDVVVYLPDNKHIIIDSKVSLIAYEAFVNADLEEDRETFRKEHLLSVKSHIKGLSEKNYQGSLDFNTPDFVMLFVPIESSFSVAIQADQELFNFAWERKVVIVSPSTLLATLLTISSIWKQERQNRNAIEIAKQSGDLYDKFVGFLDDLNDIGIKLDAGKKSYSNALNKLSSGSGNIIKRVENLKAMGAKASKSIPEKFIELTDITSKEIES